LNIDFILVLKLINRNQNEEGFGQKNEKKCNSFVAHYSQIY